MLAIDNPQNGWYFCVNQDYGIGSNRSKGFKSM
jgi:hypothetical protein